LDNTRRPRFSPRENEADIPRALHYSICGHSAFYGAITGSVFESQIGFAESMGCFSFEVGLNILHQIIPELCGSLKIKGRNRRDTY